MNAMTETEPAWVDNTTQALVAKQGDEPEMTLFWFEETKHSMGFDPEVEPEVPFVDTDWALWERHPVSLEQFMRSLAVQVAPDNPTDFLYKQGELAGFIKRMEEQEGAEHQAADSDHDTSGSSGRGEDENGDDLVH